jgi:hypothetical protein
MFETEKGRIMHGELLTDMRKEFRDAIGKDLPDEAVKAATKKMQEIADDMVSSFQYEIQDRMAEHLSYYVKEMAGRAVEALLNGNESEMVRWLSCDKRGYTGRSDGYCTKDIENQHPVIHGKLFEQGCVALRKSIAEAHRDLISSERITDLEDQVRSLVAQNNKLERERDEARERAYS